MSKKEFQSLWAYIDGRKKKVGFSYKTKNGNLCIKADKLMDAAALGRLLRNDGLYVEMSRETVKTASKEQETAPIPALRKAWN